MKKYMQYSVIINWGEMSQVITSDKCVLYAHCDTLNKYKNYNITFISELLEVLHLSTLPFKLKHN